MSSLPDRVPVPRAAPRQKVFRLAWIEAGEGRHRAHMLNLSPVGACLHLREPVRVWSSVTVQLEGRAVAARVTWVVGDRCGIKFARPLDPATMDAMLA